ncbi:hypothetical protein COCON_G00229200 [Conger conger]|uniref:Uncharacterized protein n=1 Tax=Conger conger TaxID=82655 RepID=A0A9Q1CUX3_CONCO|nr:hypothetical protein COCON_G00229200 [Conger conger]
MRSGTKRSIRGQMGTVGSTPAARMARPAALEGASCHRISKGITYYYREPETDVDVGPGAGPRPAAARPLLLLFPWLGARPRALSKYFQAYSQTGCDMLTVETDVSMFLWPRWGLDYGARVLEVLQSERFSARPLLVHSFSIGGYTFTQLLVHLSRDPRRHRCLVERIRGHVYDSLVVGTVERMAASLGKNLFPRWEFLVRWMVMLYFRIFKRYTVDHFAAAIDVFWNSPVAAPALFFFCENDSMCDHEQLETLVEHWRKRGMPVQSRKWAESTHAGHLRRHPEDYRSALDTFLLSLTPLKAKM